MDDLGREVGVACGSMPVALVRENKPLARQAELAVLRILSGSVGCVPPTTPSGPSTLSPSASTPAWGFVHTRPLVPRQLGFGSARTHPPRRRTKHPDPDTFLASDFHEARDGNCRLVSHLTHLLVDSMPMYAKAISPITEGVAHAIASSSQARSICATADPGQPPGRRPVEHEVPNVHPSQRSSRPDADLPQLRDRAD
jgi:hypothetical protein